MNYERYRLTTKDTKGTKADINNVYSQNPKSSYPSFLCASALLIFAF